MLESKRVVVVRLTLDLAPAHGRPRRVTATVAIVGAGARTPGPAAAVAAVVALVAAWHATSGIRSSAAADAIFGVGATVAVIAAAPTIVTAVAVAAAAPLAARRPTAVHAYTPQTSRWGWKRRAFPREAFFHGMEAAYKPAAGAHI